MQNLRMNFFILIALLLVTPAFAKKVNVEWKEIKGAVSYEIQISKDEKIHLKKALEDPAWSGDLPYGVYSFQIRGIDRVNRPGVWSAERPLVVMPKAPELVSPRKGTVGLYENGATIALKWNQIEGATKYKLEVKSGSKTVIDQIVEGTSFDFKPTGPGEIAWKVTGVLEAVRGPASVSGKQWQSPASDEAEFEIERKQLEAPSIAYPIGNLAPPTDGKLKFKWSGVDGAEGYEIRVKPTKLRTPAATGGEEKVYYTTEDSYIAEVPGEGKYAWEVRAIANKDSKGVAGAVGPKSTSDFELDRNANFFEGAGYIALSGMISPYTYTADSQTNVQQSNAKSLAMVGRLSGEYFFQPLWGVGAAVENAMFRMASKNYNRIGYELTVRHRMKLSPDKYSWYFYPKVGIEGREYFVLVPPAGSANIALVDAFRVAAIGPTVGFDLRRQITDKFSLGMKTGYWMPLTQSGSNGLASSTENTRNWNLGLQGMYWGSERVGYGFGGFYDQRSLAVKRGTGNTVDKVKMDATYFFGSVIYSFGK